MNEPKVFLTVPKVITVLEAEHSGLPTVDECPYVAVISFYGAKRHQDESQDEIGKAIVPDFAQIYASSLDELESVTIELLKASIDQLRKMVTK